MSKNKLQKVALGLFIFLPLLSLGQDNLKINWSKTTGGYYDDRFLSDGNGAQILDNGDILIGFNSFSDDGDIKKNNGLTDMVIQLLTADGNTKFISVFGGSEYDYVTDLNSDFNDGYIITGQTDSDDGDIDTSYGKGDVWVANLNNQGKISWQTTIGGSSGDQLPSIIKTTDSCFLIVSQTQSTDLDAKTNHGNADILLTKLDRAGKKIWSKCYGGSGFEHLQGKKTREYIITRDNNILLSVTTDSRDGDISNSIGSDDIWLVKIDLNGNVIWDKTIGGKEREGNPSLRQLNNGDIMLHCLTYSTEIEGYKKNGDGLLCSLDSLGNTKWMKCYGGSAIDIIIDALPHPDSSVIVLIETESNDIKKITNKGKRDLWLFSIDYSGDIIWQLGLGGELGESGYALNLLSDQSILVLAGSAANSSTYGDVYCGQYPGSGAWYKNNLWFVKVSRAGNLIWQKCLGGSNSDNAHRLYMKSNDEIILFANSKSSDLDVPDNKGDWDVWIASLETSLLSSNEQLEDSYAINIYPNPSNKALHITSQARLVEISIYDYYGKLVVSKKFDTDSKEYVLELSENLMGFYFLNCKTTNGMYEKKILVE